MLRRENDASPENINISVRKMMCKLFNKRFSLGLNWTGIHEKRELRASCMIIAVLMRKWYGHRQNGNRSTAVDMFYCNYTQNVHA